MSFERSFFERQDLLEPLVPPCCDILFVFRPNMLHLLRPARYFSAPEQIAPPQAGSRLVGVPNPTQEGGLLRLGLPWLKIAHQLGSQG